MNKLTTAIVLASAGLSSISHAGDLNINGFLSVGASMLSNDKIAMDGYDNNGGFKQDTILGLQLSQQVNDSTTVTGQLVSRGAEDYKTESAWAYVSFAANEDLDLRMGRLRVPFYYYSDFLEVGYAYDWVRPPAEVYSVPFSSIDGVDATYRFTLGNWDSSAQVYYGRFSPAGAGVDLKNFTGFALSSGTGDFTLRASYHRLEIEADGTGSFGGPNAQASASVALLKPSLNPSSDAAVDAELDKIAADLALTGQEIGFYGLAAGYYNGDISAIAEYTQGFSDSAFFLDNSSYLIKLGKRFGDFGTHITYTASESTAASGLEGDVQEALKLEDKQSSIIIGTRYDYDSGTTLKLEIQQLTEDMRAGTGEIDESGLLYTVAIDLVF
jgi:hypothetical protein